MKINLIQIQQDLSLNHFAQHGQEQQYESVLQSARWPIALFGPSVVEKSTALTRM